MKRFGTIAVAGFYLVLSLGIAKSTHICMGRALPASFFSFDAKSCACGDLGMPDTCCKDEIEFVKIVNDQAPGQAIDSPAPGYFLLGELFDETVQVPATRDHVALPVTYIPPPPTIPIYVAVCSRIFYEAEV